MSEHSSEFAQLPEVAQSYSDILNNLEIGFVIWRTESLSDSGSLRLVGANSAASRIFGIDLKGYYGRTLASSFPGLLSTEVPNALLEVALSSRQRNLGEIQYGDKMIPESVFTVKAFPVADNFVGLAIEKITGRKQFEETLRQGEARYRVLVETAVEGIVTIDIRSKILFANESAGRIFGYSLEEILGQEITILMPDYLRHVHRAAVSRYLETGHRHVDWARVELPGLHKEGHEIPVELSIAEHFDAGEKRFTGILRDVSERKRAEETLRRQAAVIRLLQTVAVAANEAGTVEEVMRVALSKVCGYTGWPLGHVYIRSDAPFDELVSSLIWYAEQPDRFRSFREATERTRLRSGQGLPGRVLASGKPLWIPDVTKDSNFPRAQGLRDLEVRAAFAFPVYVKNTVVAVLEFFSDREMQADEELLEMMDHVGGQVGRVIERKRAEESSRHLSAYVLRSQDKERRRIGRELHDSVGQYLTALNMNFDALTPWTWALEPNAKALLAECREIVTKCTNETRTLSYLLHPPLLEEMGLASAVPWYIEGFSKRSGIAVNVDIKKDLARLPPEAEIVLFRIVQESLANIHRHSGSRTATIRISSDSVHVFLEISDEGRGMPADVLGRGKIGVGIAGMRERLTEIGGELQIISGPGGTTVKALIPIVPVH